MENQTLTGIERQLVLQYLMDGNVPVTITPILNDSGSKTSEAVHPVDSQIFPVAIKPEKITVKKDGKIYLENPPEALISNASKLKVEFYFNRVGLYFTTDYEYETSSDSSKKLVIFLPEVLNRIKDVEEKIDYAFSADLYFDVNGKKELNEKCIPWNEEELFERPMWKSIPLENQKTAKEYLEKFVQETKTGKIIGNGLQLIPICNFLTFDEDKKISDIADRRKNINILYVDHERIVLGLPDNFENTASETSSYVENAEYGLKLSFSIKNSPILSRDIFVTFRINKIYTAGQNSRKCLDCIYTSIQEEDIRYLYEKTTSRLFI